jgi:hypothetical protein
MISLKSTLHHTIEPMKLFLVPTMVFVGCIIWKNKSGWFLFVMSLGLSVATENVLLLVSIADFHPKFFEQLWLTIPILILDK